MRKQSSLFCLFLAVSGFSIGTRNLMATDYVWARSQYGASNVNRPYSTPGNGYGGYYVPQNARGYNYEGSPFRNAGGLVVPGQSGVYNAPQQAYPQSYNSQPSGTQQSSTTALHNFDGGEVVLFSASETPGDVQYTLNGVSYVIKPGQVQRFTNDRTWIIEIPPSAGQAQQRFTLATGRYKLKPAANGVGLFQTADQPGGGTAPTPATK